MWFASETIQRIEQWSTEDRIQDALDRCLCDLGRDNPNKHLWDGKGLQTHCLCLSSSLSECMCEFAGEESCEFPWEFEFSNYLGPSPEHLCESFSFSLINISAPNQGPARLELFHRLSLCGQDERVIWGRGVVDGLISAAREDRFYISFGFSNRLLNSHLYPVGFIDHDLVNFDLYILQTPKYSSYWYFIVKLPQNINFCYWSEVFWGVWRGGRGTLIRSVSGRSWWKHTLSTVHQPLTSDLGVMTRCSGVSQWPVQGRGLQHA